MIIKNKYGTGICSQHMEYLLKDKSNRTTKQEKDEEWSIRNEEYIRDYCEAIGSSHNEKISKDADLITQFLLSKMEDYKNSSSSLPITRDIAKMLCGWDRSKEITFFSCDVGLLIKAFRIIREEELFDLNEIKFSKDVKPELVKVLKKEISLGNKISSYENRDCNPLLSDENLALWRASLIYHKEEIKILNREKSAKKNNYPNANNDHNYQKRKGVKRWNRSNYKNL